MNITWVVDKPSGYEKGAYLTLDLGGTNVRVCWIVLSGERGGSHVTQSQYKLAEELKIGNAEGLWDHIADALANFIEDQKLGDNHEHPIPLRFTFSYPTTQDYIDHGVLQTWTKGFDIKGVEGCDVASQLREALAKRVKPEPPLQSRRLS
jgi:hexokinase